MQFTTFATAALASLALLVQAAPVAEASPGLFSDFFEPAKQILNPKSDATTWMIPGEEADDNEGKCLISITTHKQKRPDHFVSKIPLRPGEKPMFSSATKMDVRVALPGLSGIIYQNGIDALAGNSSFTMKTWFSKTLNITADGRDSDSLYHFKIDNDQWTSDDTAHQCTDTKSWDSNDVRRTACFYDCKDKLSMITDLKLGPGPVVHQGPPIPPMQN